MPASFPSSPADSHTNDPTTYPVITLTEGVVLPEMVVTFVAASTEARRAATAADASTGGAGELLLVPPDSGIGVVATIEDRHDDTLTLRGRRRVRLGAGISDADGVLLVAVSEVDEKEHDPAIAGLVREHRALVDEVVERLGLGRRRGWMPDDGLTPSARADALSAWPDLSLARRVELLTTVPIADRLRLGIGWLRDALADLEVRAEIAGGVAADLDDQQRQAILRRQLAAIRAELGETDGDAANQVADYQRRLDDLALAADPSTEAAATAVQAEIDRLARSPEASTEAGWSRTWLDTVLDLPWGERSQEKIDLANARALLEGGHTGLDEVKERLVQYLAVRKLRHERAYPRSDNQQRDGSATERSGAVLALVGPPGVGKTSLGQSVADALGRRFVRLALGGIRDEAEIRGHRRTYVGSRPGRIVAALREAGTLNPVILLDEIDKVGAGWQGDPTAALLEVLDPAQNHTFRDHYLEFELDLSDVVFIATANTLETIPAALLDRLEIITIDGYSEREKATILRDHLLPQSLADNGLRPAEIVLTDDVVETLVADHAPGAGVRPLRRQLDKLLRTAATGLAEGVGTDEPVTFGLDDLEKILGAAPHRESPAERVDRPGVVAGLAVTGGGGDVLFVEAAVVPGAGEAVVTGQLGDVMKESVRIAQSVVAQRGLKLPEDHHLHVHFPAGAVPKDGPSAGVTLVTAITSLLSNVSARPSVAMTGEVTLSGRVLPIGGVKQKLLAAHRAGVAEALIPAANARDLDDLPTDVLDQLTVHLVADVDRVVSLALT